MSKKREGVAWDRWKLLAKALLLNEYSSSPSSWPGFELFSKKERKDLNTETDKYIEYALPNEQKLLVKLNNSKQISRDKVVGFDNTGNVCIWPSEEVLAHYCLSNLKFFEKKDVIEIAAGATALAALSLAIATATPTITATSPSSSVPSSSVPSSSSSTTATITPSTVSSLCLSDGNLQCSLDIQANIELNAASLKTKKIEGCLFRWEDAATHTFEFASKFDVIIAADCLFLEQYHDNLVDVARLLLKPNSDSCMLILAPKRGKSFDNFVAKASKEDSGLKVKVTRNYDMTICRLHAEEVAKATKQQNNANSTTTTDSTATATTYNVDRHYPLLIRISLKQ